MPDALKLAVGFITYGETTAKYLPYFLPSLRAQTFRETKILAIDNGDAEDNENSRYIRAHYPEIWIEWAGANIGFARAFNRLIRQAAVMGAEYFLALNPDMILELDAVAKLISALDNNPSLGSVCPKVLRWDFPNRAKTEIIDTCGIVLKPGLRFIDLGQGQKDEGHCDHAPILGPSGAAAMYRLDALERVKESDNYFDEKMFMYKEDCDLAYRLFLAGFKSECVCEAIVYHDRTVKGTGHNNLAVALNRASKSRQAKEWSFLNQHIIFLKHWGKQDFFNKLAVLWYAFKMFVFALLFERYLLRMYGTLITSKEISKDANASEPPSGDSAGTKKTI